jgi:hypothetical protein
VFNKQLQKLPSFLPMADLQLGEDQFENDHVENEPQVLPPEDPALNKYQKQRREALRVANDPAACFWYYFTPKLIEGKAAFTCNCCQFASHSPNPAQVMRSHLGNTSCQKKGGSQGLAARRVRLKFKI